MSDQTGSLTPLTDQLYAIIDLSASQETLAPERETASDQKELGTKKPTNVSKIKTDNGVYIYAESASFAKQSSDCKMPAL